MRQVMEVRPDATKRAPCAHGRSFGLKKTDTRRLTRTRRCGAAMSMKTEHTASGREMQTERTHETPSLRA